jgi:hypothetical protein
VSYHPWKKNTKAIEQLKNGKATGVDDIPKEIWKDGGPALHSKFHELLVFCLEQDKLSRDLCDAVITTLYKNKGEKSDCSNYRGIILFSVAGKTIARVLLNRLVPTTVEDHLPKPSVASEAPQTWSSSSGSSKRNAESRTMDYM